MDIRRPTRHFQLSSDPRQPQTSDAAEPAAQLVEPSSTPVAPVEPAVSVTPPTETQPEPVVPAPAPTPAAEPEQTDQHPTPEVAFVPPPPEVKPAEPPVIESMQPQVVEEPKIEEKPAAPQPPKQNVIRYGVPKRYVIAGALVFMVLLVGSVAVQQMAIAQLKRERAALAEQVKLVNPISVGENATNKPE